MGPGYEQCIQVLVMELLRKDEAPPAVTGLADEDFKAAWNWSDDVYQRVSAELGGMSGAQVAAARSYARSVMKHGFEYGFDYCRTNGQSNRVILVSKNWPGERKAPQPSWAHAPDRREPEPEAAAMPAGIITAVADLLSAPSEPEWKGDGGSFSGGGASGSWDSSDSSSSSDTPSDSGGGDSSGGGSDS